MIRPFNDDLLEDLFYKIEYTYTSKQLEIWDNMNSYPYANTILQMAGLQAQTKGTPTIVEDFYVVDHFIHFVDVDERYPTILFKLYSGVTQKTHGWYMLYLASSQADPKRFEYVLCAEQSIVGTVLSQIGYF